MRKYVYLFELDSVRKTDAEIIAGQKALYNEIITNGNIVVMTYNQIVDSRGFFSLLSNSDYSKGLYKLFQKGAIRLSQYGDIRTVAQYLLNSIEEEKEFIYSALPLKYCQKHLTALMRRCLMYSDLSELHHYIYIKEDEYEKLDTLFLEIKNGKECSSMLSHKQMQQVLTNLYSLLEMVLKISILHEIYIEPRDTKEYKNLKLWNYLNAVLEFEETKEYPLYAEAVQLIKDLKAFKEYNQNRSVYLRQIYNTDGYTKRCKQYAQAIVDLCYNYACENSICNISKHYNVDELLNCRKDKITFQTDFFARLQLYWLDANEADVRFPINETNEFVQFNKIEQIPNIQEVVRLVDYVNYKDENGKGSIERYEYAIDKQQKRQKKNIVKAILKKFFFAFICIEIACVVEFLFNWLQDRFDTYFTLDVFFETIFMLCITEMITSVLSKWFPNVLTLSEAIGGIRNLIVDVFKICRKKNMIYRNKCVRNVDMKEQNNNKHMIRYVCSKELKKYIEWKNRQVAISSPIMVNSQIYPLLDINEAKNVEMLTELEEMYSYHFGIVYESRYNKMIVDPVLSENGSVFPYERVIPTNDDGVVILPVFKERYVLLRQFRHAIRREQYAFPRGFSDPGCTILDNVRRELEEELGTKIIGEPVKLGRITPDSGMTSGSAYAYKVEIGTFEEKVGYEGIKQIITVSDDEFSNLISTGEIDDGYTLGAYLLYKKYLGR